MNFDLSEDQLAFQNLSKDFASKELAPFAAEWDAKSHFPKEVIAKAGELGFCSLYVPEADGGMGLGRLDASIIIEQLSAGCTSTTAFITIHNMALWMLSEFGSEELKNEWCPSLSLGKKLASYCLTEAGAGSDAASIKTSAKKVDDGYVLNGSKSFISGSGDTDCLILMARTGEEGAGGISCFLIPANTKGIDYGKKEEKMGWKSQPTRIVSLSEVKIPLSNLIGKEGQGFKIAMKGLDGGRINIATCSIGTAQAALTAAQEYMNENNSEKK